MKLSLDNWLKADELKECCLLVSGSEDCVPLVNSLFAICRQKLKDFNHRCSFNADRFFDFEEINNLVSETSLFGDKNFIELNFKTKPTMAQQKQLLALIPQLGDTNFLGISCGQLDKKELAGEWIVNLQNTATHIPLNADYSEGYAWARYLFANNGFYIEPEALEALLNLNQNNFAQMYQEINKLCLLFKAPHNLSYSDIKGNLLDNAQYNIFALSSAYLKGDIGLARKIFNNICQSVDEAILIIWNLGEDLRKLIRIKGRLRTNANFNSAIEGLRIWGEGISQFKMANSRLTYKQLLTYYDELAQVDLCIKGVIAKDALLLLENLIINVCIGK